MSELQSHPQERTTSSSSAAAPPLLLGIPGFGYGDLFQSHGLRRLYDAWEQELADGDPELHGRYVAYRGGAHLGPVELSNLLTEVAPWVSRFLRRLFPQSGPRLAEIFAATGQDLHIFRLKDEFIKRRASKRPPPSVDETAKRVAILEAGQALCERLGLSEAAQSDELALAKAVCALLDTEAGLKARGLDDPELVAVRQDLETIGDWLMVRREELIHKHHFLSLHFPHSLDHQRLVPLRRPDDKLPELFVGHQHKLRHRDGFKLTDRRMSAREVLDQVDYCMYCHDRDKDSCSKGLRDKSGAVKQNAIGVSTPGCPLHEKISEMHILQRQGDPLGALALVTLDNPMCPGTGHRICNDCMKACIYQKQEPVNIPQIETAALSATLALPYGVEIYGLLTRWNPLNVHRPYPLPYNGRNVLVVGLGPAGYTLCHHLLREGFGVLGTDGLKLEPPPAEQVGDLRQGVLPQPIYDWPSLAGELDERILSGFGGVSEYGITVRWDKNFLSLLYMTLARQANMRFYGGVRFGGTLTLDDAWQLGIDHVAIAAGAGKPTLVDIENNLCRGIRKASDFLMALQLSGAFKKDSLANLQIRLPALVIGGGLTAIDTATELLAYYIVQVEKTLHRWEFLRRDIVGSDAAAEAQLLRAFDVEEREILLEQLAHGRQVRAERQQASVEKRDPNFTRLLDSWGGVSLVYRKNLIDSPAYRLNHEEVEKSLEEGVRYIERMSPKAALVDDYGAIRAMTFERQHQDDSGHWHATGQIIELAARTVCVAAGTSPNTVYEKEHPGTFVLGKGGYFAPHRAVAVGDSGGHSLHVEPSAHGFFTSYLKDGHVVSYYGDNHPRYAGSVVKAMASAKDGFSHVSALYPADLAVAAAEAKGHATPSPEQQARDRRWQALIAHLDDQLIATVVRVDRLTSNIVDVVVRAPLAARKFQPGQFYRLQNFERNAPVVNGGRLAMEGLALTGAAADPETGILSLIVLEMGGSSSLCARLKPGEQVVVMGPTGAPTEIPHGETVCLVGGGLGNAVLFSIARALKQSGCKVLYFAGYKKPDDVYKQDEIEAGTDQVIWACDVAPPPGSTLGPRRPQDRMFVGNIVEAMATYARGELAGGLPAGAIDLRAASRIIVIGSDRMMAAVTRARHAVLKPYLNPQHIGIGSINSPMQCMMKEVCAQCLQKHTDPVTGKETVVFSCFNQDQELDRVNWNNLAARLRQNSTQEKLIAMWLERTLKQAAN